MLVVSVQAYSLLAGWMIHMKTCCACQFCMPLCSDGKVSFKGELHCYDGNMIVDE